MRTFTLDALRLFILSAACVGCAPIDAPIDAGSAVDATGSIDTRTAHLTGVGTRLVSADAHHLEFVIEAPAPRFAHVDSRFGVFQRLEIDPMLRPSGDDALGQPEVPVAEVRFGVPVDGEIARMTVRPEGGRTFEDVRLYPIQTSNSERDAELHFDPDAYARPTLAEVPRSVSVERSAGLSVARARFHLADYDPEALRLTMYGRLRIRIELRGDCLMLGEEQPRPSLDVEGPGLDGLLNIDAMRAAACVLAAPEGPPAAAPEEPPAAGPAFRWVIILDESSDRREGTPGADICGATMSCGGGDLLAISGALIAGDGVVCDGRPSDICGDTPRDRPAAALDDGSSCEPGSSPSDYVSIGMAGMLALDFGRDLVGCSGLVVELQGGDEEAYGVYICQTDALDADTCILGRSIVEVDNGGSVSFDVPAP